MSRVMTAILILSRCEEMGAETLLSLSLSAGAKTGLDGGCEAPIGVQRPGPSVGVCVACHMYTQQQAEESLSSGMRSCPVDEYGEQWRTRAGCQNRTKTGNVLQPWNGR